MNQNNDDDNESIVSNDESICPNRTEGVIVDNDSDSDGDEDLTEDERAKKSALALKKLGNINRKPLDSNAIIDIVVVGKLLLQKHLLKSRQKALRKQARKRDIIYHSMKYFSAQMEERRRHLAECLRRSADHNSVYKQCKTITANEYMVMQKHYM